ncbi:cation diffusion facilitator family transporter [Cohnella sp. AR92]|uniref:cation diffusion facilitator family transporter n=1 Tax=Cohnella sp. AR92 TaxID=648716 RepID=UPI000F8CD376|nr:cation diffusion facilitator family transporter [Cohnella sp. AR92]RUS47704.1 cation transporter [Cohnella sp. AR92]
MSQRRFAGAEHGAGMSALGLLGLSILKGGVGWLTGSRALLADACHSAADTAAATTTYLEMRRVGHAPRTHLDKQKLPAEAVVGIVFSALLFVGGIEIAISSIRKMARGVDEAPGWSAVAVIVFGIFVREGLIRYRRRYESRLGMRPDSVRGESRSDIFASLTALVGSVGAMTGELFDIPSLYFLDPAAGIVIGVFVMKSGYQLVQGVIRSVDDSSLDEVDVQSLLEAVQRVDGVVAVEGLRARELGHYVIVDLTIRVNPRITVFEGQDIALRVRRQLTKRFLHVTDANVQVQPFDPGYPYKSNHQEEELGAFVQ